MEAHPMTEDRLRRWLRGQLPPDERREVSRWLVKHPNPDVARLLRGMLRADREAERDAALSRRDPRGARLVLVWDAAFASGGAAWDDASGAALLAATVPPDADTPAVSLGTGVVVLGPPLGAEVGAWLALDDGTVLRLRSPGPAAAGERVPLPAVAADRATAWAAWGPALPRHDDPAAELHAALDPALGAAVRAVRWEPSD